MKLFKKLIAGIAIAAASLMNFAFAADATINNLGDLAGSVNENAGTIFNIVMIIATLAGLILIIKGLVHLKQNYTGSGQEKHMSKGIASLVFGTALILAIPISHMLVGTVGASGAGFETGVGNVTFESVPDTGTSS